MLKKSLLLDLSFASVILIVLSNLNGIANLLFGVTSPFSVFILVFCLIISYALFRYGSVTLPLWAFWTMLALFFAIGTISWFFYSYTHIKTADYYKVFRKTVPAFILTFAVYKYMLYASDRGRMLNVLYFITFSLLITTFMVPIGALTNIFSGSFKVLMYGGGGRSAGLFASPNLAGVHANFALAFVLFFIVQSKRFSLLFLLLVPIVLYASFLTFSKATIIISGFLIVIFFIYHSAIILSIPRARRRRFSLAILMILLGVIAFFPKIQELTANLNFQQLQRLQQIGDLLQGNVDEATTTDRSTLWGEAIGLIASQPIQGWGISGLHNLPEGRLGAHNTYLMVWGEAGILPFIAMMVYIVSAYYRCFFWIRDPSYRFLALSLLFVITIQMYGASHNGLSNSEAVIMTAIVIALIQTQRGRIEHLRHGKYLEKDYRYQQSKLASQNGRLLHNE